MLEALEHQGEFVRDERPEEKTRLQSEIAKVSVCEVVRLKKRLRLVEARQIWSCRETLWSRTKQPARLVIWSC
jgi:hypothetical protein